MIPPDKDSFFDKGIPFDAWQKNLPHRDQPGKIQFITFRTVDSLPVSVLDSIRFEKQRFHAEHLEPWDDDTRKLYLRKFGKVFDYYEDKGYGNCWLQRPEVREPLIEALHHRDGTDYDIDCYVIMPNHVHILMSSRKQRAVDIIDKIKSFSATKINRILGRKGRVWMSDDFDRLVRNMQSLLYYRRYIIQNPRHLSPEEYELYLAPYLRNN